ncbi:Conserved_hypothetical protein [Hexamita inflata]|uniref:CCR4-NOT transcription complex subunit 1 HEAT repeat domain-containing protein n=1 Tax=Hexamita inflata TaxID=28002 RepID=A0AA86PL09_9EUKA|nr:Conserved hypothetical protein [Hexamita inflata]
MTHNLDAQGFVKKLVAKQQLELFTKQIPGLSQTYGVAVVFNAAAFELLNRCFGNQASRQFCQTALAWLLRQYQSDFICLECFADLMNKLSIALNNPQTILSFVEELSGVDVQLKNTFHLLSGTSVAAQISAQIQRSGTQTEQFSVQIYQKYQQQRNRPLPTPQNLVLQKLIKYGYNVCLSEVILKTLFREQKQLTNQFVADLLFFITQTYQHPFVPKTPLQTIIQSLGLNPSDVVAKEIQLENWDVSLIFKVLQQIYGQVKLVEAIKLIVVPNSFFYPLQIIYTIFSAQFGLQDIKCYCSECSFKQQDFQLIEQICSDKFEIQGALRLNILIGLISLCNSVNEELQKQNTQLKYQQQHSLGLEPKQVEQLLNVQKYVFYINFSRTRCTSTGKDPLQQMMDAFAYQWKKQGLNMNRTCAIEVKEVDTAEIVQTSIYIWRSIDFVKQLIKLQPDFPNVINFLGGQKFEVKEEVLKYVQNPVEKCGEQLAYTLSHLQLDPFVKAVSALCLYKYFNKQGRTKTNTPVVELICKNCPELIDFTLQSIWYTQPQLTGKLLDTSQEQKCLQLCVKSPSNLYFGLDMTTIAAGRQLINLSLYLNGQFMQFGHVFAEAVCVFLLKKLIKFKKQIDGQFENSVYYKKYVKMIGEEYQVCVSQPSLGENLRLANFKQQNYLFEDDFGLLRLSDAAISESLVGCFYRILVFYAQYFERVMIKDTKLSVRLKTLFEYATEMCSVTFPRIQLNLGSDLSLIEPDSKKIARTLVASYLSEQKTKTQFQLEVDLKFKGQDAQERFCYICIVNNLVNVLQDNQAVYALLDYKYPEDATKASVARINAAQVLGQLLAQGLVQDVFQPRLLQLVINSLYDQKDEYICKYVLNNFIDTVRNLNQKDEFKGLNFAQDWFSFYDALYNAPSLQKHLQPENFNYIKDKALKTTNSIKASTEAVQNADLQARKSDLSQIVNDSNRVIRAIQLDREIVEQVQNKSKMNYKPVAQVQIYGNAQDTLKDKLIFAQNLTDKQFESHAPQLINDLQGLVAKDVNAVAEFIAMQILCNLPLNGLVRILVLLSQLTSQLHQLIFRYCISIILRLINLPSGYTLTEEQIEQRRNKIERIGQYLAVYCTKFDLQFISKKDLDFLFIIDFAFNSQTLFIVSKFITSYLCTLVERCDILPQSSGLFLITLNYLNEKCQMLEPLENNYRQLVEIDIQSSSKQLYKDESVLSGNLVQLNNCFSKYAVEDQLS